LKSLILQICDGVKLHELCVGCHGDVMLNENGIACFSTPCTRHLLAFNVLLLYHIVYLFNLVKFKDYGLTLFDVYQLFGSIY